MKFWFKTILYIINGRIEIVGILLARVYMQRLKNYRVVIHIKNHNLCIILSFLLVSYNQMCILLRGGA